MPNAVQADTSPRMLTPLTPRPPLSWGRRVANSVSQPWESSPSGAILDVRTSPRPRSRAPRRSPSVPSSPVPLAARFPPHAHAALASAFWPVLSAPPPPYLRPPPRATTPSPGPVGPVRTHGHGVIPVLPARADPPSSPPPASSPSAPSRAHTRGLGAIFLVHSAVIQSRTQKCRTEKEERKPKFCRPPNRSVLRSAFCKKAISRKRRTQNGTAERLLDSYHRRVSSTLKSALRIAFLQND